jgi:hypothetical protein
MGQDQSSEEVITNQFSVLAGVLTGSSFFLWVVMMPTASRHDKTAG